MACLDTTVLVDILREARRKVEGPAHAKFKELSSRNETVVITRINEAEFLAGGYDAGIPAISLPARERFLSEFPVLELDAGAARQYAIWDSTLAARGETVGAFDLMIASIAFSNGHSVVTRNRKEFERIPSLSVEPY
ncbi:MAG TPA: type II toxin-antitoxin system VapC family toxin [Thermoplasmata archaeon]|nr:type II toxin-antitoxin system VapC family toxin [Thermoplasmata archaeon]